MADWLQTSQPEPDQTQRFQFLHLEFVRGSHLFVVIWWYQYQY